MFTDVHCHLNDERFTDLDGVVNGFRAEKVNVIINAGYDLQSSLKGSKIAEKYAEVFFTSGAHPDAEKEVDDVFLEKIKTLSEHVKCVGIGEIGLDYHYEGFDKEGQKRAFVKQLELADFLSLPVVIHTRDATEDTVNVLKENKRLLKNGGVMHCFSGSKETAREYLDLGMYISFGGTVTFNNAKNVKEAALFVPSDMMLTETDSPYLSPAPFRGEVNEPKRVRIITEYLSGLKKEDLTEFALKIAKNSKRVFKKL